MKRGFTLVETLISIVLVSFVLTALYLVMSGARTTWHAADARTSLQQELRKAMRQITDDLRLSSSDEVVISADGASIEFKAPDNTTSGVINWTGAPVINYTLSADQVNRTKDEEWRVVAINISQMSFERDGNIVSIDLTAQKQAPFGEPASASLESSVALRN